MQPKETNTTERRPEVVVITGASAGIGRATARRFAKEGARICFLARVGTWRLTLDIRHQDMPLSIFMRIRKSVVDKLIEELFRGALWNLENKRSPTSRRVNQGFS